MLLRIPQAENLILLALPPNISCLCEFFVAFPSRCVTVWWRCVRADIGALFSEQDFRLSMPVQASIARNPCDLERWVCFWFASRSQIHKIKSVFQLIVCKQTRFSKRVCVNCQEDRNKTY